MDWPNMAWAWASWALAELYWASARCRLARGTVPVLRSFRVRRKLDLREPELGLGGTHSPPWRHGRRRRAPRPSPWPGADLSRPCPPLRTRASGIRSGTRLSTFTSTSARTSPERNTSWWMEPGLAFSTATGIPTSSLPLLLPSTLLQAPRPQPHRHHTRHQGGSRQGTLENTSPAL